MLSVAVMVGYAQQKPEMVKFNAQSIMAKKDFNKVQQMADKASQARKSFANKVYYTKPANAMWAGEDVKGSYYYASYLLMGANRNIVFQNQSANKAATSWTYNGNAVNADDNYDCNFGTVGCYQTNGYNSYGNTPVLSMGQTEFSLAELNINWATENQADTYKERPDVFGCKMMIDSLADMAFFDYPHALSGGAWGISHPVPETYHLFGNGYVSDQDENGVEHLYETFGCMQFYPAVENLYITSAHTIMLTEGDPLSGNAELTMTFYNVEERDGNKVRGSKVLGQLFARATNQQKLGGPYNTKYTKSGNYYYYSLEFKNEYQDDFGAWIDEPVIINGECCMVITGFDQEGVDVNIMGSVPQDEENFESQTQVLCWADDTKSQAISFGYQSPLVVDMSYTAIMDYVDVMSVGYDQAGNAYENLNVLNVSADGKTVVNENMGADYVVLYTAFPWLDNDQVDNYDYDLPEWVTEIEAEEAEAVTQQGREFRDGRVFARVACDPLPAGETGRFALIFVNGKGATSKSPIIVLQGNASLEEALKALEEVQGIDDVKVAKAVVNGAYNLNGQKVGAAYRGLVVKDGKKFFVK